MTNRDELLRTDAGLITAATALLSEVEGLRAQVTVEQNAATALNLEREIFRTGMLKERERAEKAEASLTELRATHELACVSHNYLAEETARLHSTQLPAGMIARCAECNAQEDLNLANPRLAERCRTEGCPLRAGQEG